MQNQQCYRRTRMTRALITRRFSAAHRRVGRLMRENDIRVVRTRRFKVTTNSSHTHSIEPNLLGQDFSATALNQKWTADITYIWTREGWLYLAVALELFSRRVIGWHLPDGRKGGHASGNIFSVSQSASSFMRFNVTQCEDDRIFRSLEKYWQGRRRRIFDIVYKNHSE
ncbi:DDE-type integrase/transposase/recombinase [Acetobacter malorum]|nr:DDE-type integrase/transposase/recombinase [Acetobacter malorum]